MNKPGSLLDKLRTHYETASDSEHERANIERFDRVSLYFHNSMIDEQVLEDLVKLIFGRDSAFLRRVPFAGLHSRPGATT